MFKCIWEKHHFTNSLVTIIYFKKISSSPRILTVDPLNNVLKLINSDSCVNVSVDELPELGTIAPLIENAEVASGRCVIIHECCCGGPMRFPAVGTGELC